MSDAEMMDQAYSLKNKGTEYVRNAMYDEAQERYHEACQVSLALAAPFAAPSALPSHCSRTALAAPFAAPFAAPSAIRSALCTALALPSHCSRMAMLCQPSCALPPDCARSRACAACARARRGGQILESPKFNLHEELPSGWVIEANKLLLSCQVSTDYH